MTSIVFVHGTGVRQPAYDETFAVLETAFGKRHPGCRLVRCFYGTPYGARPGRLSLPPDDDRAKGMAPDEPDDIDAWAVLYADPLAELRWLARTNVAPLGGAPGSVPYPKRAATELLALKTRETWRDAFARARLGPDAPDALDLVARFPQLEAGIAGAAAIVAAGDGDRYDAARESLARAVVAASIASAAARAQPLPDGAARDALVALTFATLGGAPATAKGAWKSALKLALKPVGWAVKRGGTWYASRNRGSVSDGVSPFPGDILVYLANGEPIRRHIAAAVADAKKDGPVYLLAHSLGGIACVELLAHEDLGVAGLITAGSQAPFLFEMGALRGIPADRTLPRAFPRWLNVYDRNDLLSYCGNTLFGDRVQDVEVHTGQPFPEAHSAYWATEAFWTAVKAFLP